MGLTRAVVDVAPLRSSPPFRRLLIGRTCSGFGSQMTFVAVIFQVWQATHSTAWTGALGVAMAAPVIAFGLVAGALVDRVDRRRLYLVTVVGQTACSIVLAGQGFLGHVPPAVVLVIVAVQACFVAAGGPASRTFLPRLLPRTRLAAGLALSRITFQAALLAGPALGGLVLGWLGVGGCYAIDSVTFAMAFYGAFGLPPMRPEGEASRPGVRAIADGLAFLVRNSAIRGALLTDLATMLLSMPISLFPLVNAERFGNDPRTLGLFLTAVAVGGVAASVLSGAFTRLPRPGLVMLAGSATWGVSLAAFGISPDRWLAFGFLALAGAADTLAVVSRSTIVQLNTPDALMGRVTAAEQIVGQACPELGNMRGGLVAGVTSGTVALVSGGLSCLLAIALIAVANPGLRRFVTAPAEPALSTDQAG
jgi:MFS family permease